MADFKLLVVGRFLPGQVRVRWNESTRLVLPQVETLIEQAWQETISTPGVRLYDGRVARLESFDLRGNELDLAISPTSYRIVVGTNFANPGLQDDFGEAVMANPLGVSTSLLTADGYWIMGRRNRSVAYYPARVHPFAGSLEVREEVDIFHDVRRELREELALGESDIVQVTHVGLVCDQTLRHPEAVFFTETRLSRKQVTHQLDPDEHDAVWSTPATPQDTAAALANDELTPVARASLLLGGRERFGVEWFERHS